MGCTPGRTVSIVVGALVLLFSFGAGTRATTGVPVPLALQDPSPLGPVELVSARDAGMPNSATATANFFHQTFPRRGMSADGRWCVFTSRSTGLLPNVTNGVDHVYVRDLVAGVTILVDRSVAGLPGTSFAFAPSITPDGSRVIFSTGSALVAEDTNGLQDIYVRDLVSGTLTLVSMKSGGGAANGHSSTGVLTPDGRFAVFSSGAKDLVSPALTSSLSNIFIRDLQEGVTSLVSVNRAGTGSGNNSSLSPEVSNDGRFVAYVSSANDLVAVDGNNQQDVFVRDRAAGVTFLASRNQAGTGSGNGASFIPVISPDGSRVVFQSQATDLFPDGNGSGTDYFVFDVLAGTVAPVTVNAGATATAIGGISAAAVSPDVNFVAFASSFSDAVPGTPPGTHLYLRDLANGTTRLLSPVINGSPLNLNQVDSIGVSNQGRSIVYSTSAPTLFPGDFNNANDIALCDVAGGTTRLLSIRPGMSVPGNGTCWQSSISADGSRVLFFSTASDLIANDFNNERDIFERDIQAGVTKAVTAAGIPSPPSATPNGYSTVQTSSLSADGRFAVFTSGAPDLLPNAVPGQNLQNVYARDLASGLMTVINRNALGALPLSAEGAVISPTGNRVAFGTSTSGLSGLPSSGRAQIYLGSPQNPGFYLVTKSWDGTAEGNGRSHTYSSQFSADGRYFFFLSEATNLVQNSITSSDVYVHDISLGMTTRAMATLNASIGFFSASSDGRFIAFNTQSSLHPQDANNDLDVYVYDRVQKVVTLVSVTSAGSSGAGASYYPFISSDGRFVMFQSHAADILPNDTNGRWDVFVRDLQTGTTKLVSVAPASANGDSFPLSINSDGRFVLFYSSASNLGPLDTNNTYDLFVRDLQLDVTHAVTINPAGTRMGNSGGSSGRLSANGRFVYFSSGSTDLVTVPTAGNQVFLRDLETAKTHLVSQSMSGSGFGSGTQLGDISADGSRVLFSSVASDLVPGDANGASDVFSRQIIPNRAPIAKAGPDQDVPANVAGGAVIHLDGSASSDPDNQPLLYDWWIVDGNGQLVGTAHSAVVDILLPPGHHIASLKVTDPFGATATDEASILIRANTRPIADAGPDQTAEASSHDGATFLLDGSHSSDPDGDSLTYTWVERHPVTGVVLRTFQGATLQIELPLGTTVLVLTVDDGKGGLAADTVSLTVVDTTAPRILTANRIQLFGAGIGMGQIYRFGVPSVGDPTLELTLQHETTQNVWGLALSPSGELFASNDWYRSIVRFVDPGTTPRFNGTITDDSLVTPFGLAFRGSELISTGELIVGFDPGTHGNALSRRVFGAVYESRGIAVAPWGEVFISDQASNIVYRFLIGDGGNFMPNGQLEGAGLSSPHNMAFSPGGELFVANLYGDSVSRFTFDGDAKQAIPGDPLTGNGLSYPVGVAFAPGGELFVSSLGAALVSRWTFDASGAPLPQGFFTTPSVLCQIAILGGSPIDPTVPIVIEQQNPAGATLTLPTPDVSDNSDASPSLVLHAPAVFPPGTTPIAWVATDASGNVTRVETTVTVIDTTPPTIQAPAAVVLEQTRPDGALYTLPPPLTSDNSGIVSVTSMPPPIFPPGETTVTFIATDASGNVSTADLKITVLDRTAPQFATAVSESSELTSTLYVVGLPDHGEGMALYRYQVDGSGPPLLDLTLTDPSFDFPTYLAFDSRGDMFVVNRGYNGTRMAVDRWKNPRGAPELVGSITQGMNHPHGAAFRGKELFVANSAGGNVLRFLFDGNGDPIANGSFDVGGWCHVVAVSPWGELFITQPGVVRRFLVDDVTGEVQSNGTLTAPGLNGYDLAFSPWGELFVANQYSGTVSRFRFDDQHGVTHTENLAAPGMAIPTGLAFSRQGELFVSEYFGGTINRFVFDDARVAFSNGSFQTPQGMGDIAFVTRLVHSLAPLTLEQTQPDGALVPLPPVIDAGDLGPIVTSDRTTVPVGTTLVTFTARDSRNNISVATQLITVTPAPPVAQDLNVETSEDHAIPMQISATSPAGLPLTYSILSSPAHGTLGGAAPNLTYTPAPDFNGTDSFTFSASDGSLDSAVATVTITVTPVNDPPVAMPDAYVTSEDTPLNGTSVLANDFDVDGDPFTAILVTGPAHGTVNLNGNGAFVYTPASNYNGADSFTYRAKDGGGFSDPVTVSLTINPTPDFVVGVSDSYSTNEDTPLVGSSVLANDINIDGDPFTAVWISGPSHGTLVLNEDGTFLYTPEPNFNGNDSFTYQARNGLGVQGFPEVTIEVRPVNDAPVAAADAFTTAEDTPLAGTSVLANDVDVDNNPLTAVLVTGAAHGTVVLNPDGTFLYTPAANYNGSDSFVYQAKDPSAAVSAPVTVSLTVTPVNDAPVALGDAYTTTRNKALTVTVPSLLANDSDVEGSSLTASLVTPPSNGSLTSFGSNGTFTYAPTFGFVGTDTFTYRVSDGALNSTLATVTINVLPVNTAPTAADDKYSFSLKKTAVLDVAAASGVLKNDSDTEGDPLSAKLVSGPSRGTLVFRPDGSFQYTPAAGDVGVTVTFTYVAFDGRAESLPATVTISVNK